ncbi:hypothetical protein WPG_3349 [Winogradskyella sp. PG-2]|nr:hypothetical protein WPG_3349 [Winogradskyella sp. PG-2]
MILSFTAVFIFVEILSSKIEGMINIPIKTNAINIITDVISFRKMLFLLITIILKK